VFTTRGATIGARIGIAAFIAAAPGGERTAAGRGLAIADATCGANEAFMVAGDAATLARARIIGRYPGAHCCRGAARATALGAAACVRRGDAGTYARVCTAAACASAGDRTMYDAGVALCTKLPGQNTQ
jgi:hypothetical protein